MSTTHTPGPWHKGSTSMNPHLVTVVGSNGAIVAEVHLRDADVITAAPRLLAALVEARRYVADQRLHMPEIVSRQRRETEQDRQDRVSDNIEANEQLRDTLAQIDAAIAEATGSAS
jgi:hypothetical protein